MLAWPPASLDFEEPPDHWLMLARPDLPLLRAQARALADTFARLGVEVHLARPAAPAPPNFLFQRDLFFTTPEGVVLARPASPRRAAEARLAAEVLAGLGVPILMTPRGTALFEGADALWVRDDEVLVGIGRRTNRAAFDQLSGLLGELGVRATAVAVPEGSQHLLGALAFVDRDLVLMREDRLSDELAGVARERGYRALVLPADDEVVHGWAMNIVTLRPGALLMPAGCPGVRSRYQAAGIEVYEALVGEYLKAAGGLGCLTGILARALT